MKEGPGIILIEIELEFIVEKKTDNIVVLDQYAFGFPGGARRVDDVGQVGREGSWEVGKLGSWEVKMVSCGQI